MERGLPGSSITLENRFLIRILSPVVKLLASLPVYLAVFSIGQSTMYRKPSGIKTNAHAGFADALSDNTRSLQSYARRLAGNAPDADDLVQETILRCWSARETFQPGTNIGAWSRVVMRNTFLSSHRRDRFHGDLPDDAFDRIEGTSGGQDLALELRDVGWALEQLSPDEREAVMLAVQGLSGADAASQLGILPSTYKSRLARGRGHLRELIDNPEAQPYAPPSKLRHALKTRNWHGVVIG
ncbi:RNA polymerase sigma factor [Sphingomonas sp. PsM26]|nr:RNA polymerase sigma factor [Sphingomonas sp. PsM26]